ncbi:MAG: glycoside hydrolase family 9 protein [Tannerellaceae bacterium]|jgi:hypothetical protein|nr:glycoside hydrolase family 9 protein [Tannerellaceae bacterium]
MKNIQLTILCIAVATGLLGLSNCQNGSGFSSSANLRLNDSAYFEKHGFNVLVFSNMYDNLFDDSKISAVEIIHHGIRTATNGDVRLNPTPGQWDPIAKFVDRKVDRENNRIEVSMNFADYDFQYTLIAEAKGDGLHLGVHVDKALPEALAGVAGLNLELFPPVFWGTSYIVDNQYGIFPTSPADNMTTINRQVEPTPMASGKNIEIAPDDPMKHLSIRLLDGDNLMLLDGRNKQQNGTFVVRTLLPAGKTGKIAEWFITGESVTEWIRTPLISYSQVGYHPSQAKRAVIELDKNDKPLSAVSLWRINQDGSRTQALAGKPTVWGMFLRYNYLQFDFSSVKEPGIYELQYGNQSTAPFPIAGDVFRRAWYPTLDVFMPVQMDHMFVREAYRVWHGAPHLDDALQAPLNRVHWDGWRQGSSTDNKYKPLQHIPGLNVGGWFDAGDFDIQTPSQQSTVQSLILTYETFGIDRDETTVNQKTRYVDIHVPDGKPDMLQQIEHGALQLLAQVKSIGYAIPGINESHLYQYRHLGDALTKTDNLVYNSQLDSLQTDGRTSGTPDDRWAFTNRSAYLNYNTAISLAAAARVLKDYNPAFAAECLETAQYIWNDEHSRPKEDEQNQPFFVRGFGIQTELLAAVELWRTTGSDRYKARIDEILPEVENNVEQNLFTLVQIAPYMGSDLKAKLEPAVTAYVQRLAAVDTISPFGVTISPSGWAANGNLIRMANFNYKLHLLFPGQINPEHIYSALNYLYGCHPAHNLSFVSGVGAQPKKVAYGNNRADFSFIPGGIVPGIRILKPDFPENRDDYPFHWSENEYVIPLAPDYIYLVNAANSLLNQ